MKALKLLMLTILLSTVSFSTTAFSGEKGGSGINEEESIILKDFQLTRMCPMVPIKKLCSIIDEEINSPKTPDEMKSYDEQIKEDFFNFCCEE